MQVWTSSIHHSALDLPLGHANQLEDRCMIQAGSHFFLWSIWSLKQRRKELEVHGSWESSMVKLWSDGPWITPGTTLLEVWLFRSPLILWAVIAPFEYPSAPLSPASVAFLANKRSTENLVLGGAASSVRTSQMVPLSTGTQVWLNPVVHVTALKQDFWENRENCIGGFKWFETQYVISTVALLYHLKPRGSHCSFSFFSLSVNGDDKIPLTHNPYRNFRRKREPTEFTGQAPGVVRR